MPLVNNIWKEASGQKKHKYCCFPWAGTSSAAYLRIKLSQDLLIVKGRMVEIHTHTKKTKYRNLWLISLATYGNILCMKRSHSILISWQLYSVVHGSSVKGYGARSRDCTESLKGWIYRSQHLLIICWISYWPAHYSEGKLALRENSSDTVYSSQKDDKYT